MAGLLIGGPALAGDDGLNSLLALAEQGVSAAQFDLGNRYLEGNGVQRSQFEALHWFRLAAEQENINAQYNLAVMYLNGMGVVEDTEQAIRWFHRAAENGDPAAQYNLGVFYANAVHGLQQDLKRAWMWFSLAGAAGMQNASANAVLLQEFLGEAELMEAQRMAQEQIERIREQR